MKRTLSGKSNKDTEFSSDTLINPLLTGILHRKTIKSPTKLSITEQHQETPQIDDFDEKKYKR